MSRPPPPPQLTPLQFRSHSFPVMIYTTLVYLYDIRASLVARSRVGGATVAARGARALESRRSSRTVGWWGGGVMEGGEGAARCLRGRLERDGGVHGQ